MSLEFTSTDWAEGIKDLIQHATDKSHYRNRISVGQIIGNRDCSARYTVYPRVGKHTYNQYLAGNTTASVHGALSYIDLEGNNTNFSSTNSNTYLGAVTNSNTYGATSYIDKKNQNKNTNLDCSNSNTYLGEVTNNNTYGSTSYIDSQWDKDKEQYTGTYKNTNLPLSNLNTYYGEVTNSNTYGATSYIDTENKNTNLPLSNLNTYYGEVNNNNAYGSTSYIDTENKNTNLAVTDQKTVYGLHINNFKQGDQQYLDNNTNTNHSYISNKQILGQAHETNIYGLDITDATVNDLYRSNTYNGAVYDASNYGDTKTIMSINNNTASTNYSEFKKPNLSVNAYNVDSKDKETIDEEKLQEQIKKYIGTGNLDKVVKDDKQYSYTNYTISLEGTLEAGQKINPFKSFTLTITDNAESRFITDLLKAEELLGNAYTITEEDEDTISIKKKQ